MNRRIDLHHHILPPAYISRERDRLLKSAPAYAWTLDWTPQFSLEAMDKAGIAAAVTSISTLTLFADAAPAQALARDCNDYAADLGRRHPGRFGMFASLPMPHVVETLAEIAYAYDALKAEGVCMMTNYGDRWPGDPAFARVFDELNARRAVVFFHPTVSPRCAGLIPELPNAFLEYPFDTTRAIGSLLYSGTLTRCPDIRFIFSHGGGALPMLAHRLAMLADVRKDLAARVPGGVLPALANLYYDTCSVTNPASFGALRQIAPLSHVIYGTDLPYMQPPDPQEFATLALGAAELDAIQCDNALHLLPQFA